jgi:hypothetical protein
LIGAGVLIFFSVLEQEDQDWNLFVAKKILGIGYEPKSKKFLLKIVNVNPN